MTGDAPITWLMFLTLGAGILVAAGMLLLFLRSRHNRESAVYALKGGAPPRGVEPSGAGVELAALLAIALLAMGLLTLGYHSQSASMTASNGAGPNNQLATERTEPNTPKRYQPANPAPDTRTAPTGSTTGQGSDSGGRPEGQPKQQ